MGNIATTLYEIEKVAMLPTKIGAFFTNMIIVLKSA